MTNPVDPVRDVAETVGRAIAQAIVCPDDTVCAECAGAGEWEDVQVLAAEDLRYHLVTCPDCGGTGAA